MLYEVITIGVILISRNAQHIDLDLDCVLFGEIAYVPWDSLIWNGYNLGPVAIWMLGATFLIVLITVVLFYKQFKICAFDPALAAALGVITSYSIHYTKLYEWRCTRLK